MFLVLMAFTVDCAGLSCLDLKLLVRPQIVLHEKHSLSEFIRARNGDILLSVYAGLCVKRPLFSPI